MAEHLYAVPSTNLGLSNYLRLVAIVFQSLDSVVVVELRVGATDMARLRQPTSK